MLKKLVIVLIGLGFIGTGLWGTLPKADLVAKKQTKKEAVDKDGSGKKKRERTMFGLNYNFPSLSAKG